MAGPRDFLRNVSAKEILAIHRRSAARQHAGAGVRSAARVADLVGILRRGGQRGEGPVEIIAKVYANINRDPQPFVDCNHRTAMAVGRLVARAHGARLRYTEAAVRKLRREWEDMTLRDFRTWVAQHLA